MHGGKSIECWVRKAAQPKRLWILGGCHGVKRSHLHSGQTVSLLTALSLSLFHQLFILYKQAVFNTRLSLSSQAWCSLELLDFSTNTFVCHGWRLEETEGSVFWIRKGNRSGSQASNIQLQESTALGRVEMSSGGEYDAAFAATIAAAAYAIAAREEKLAIQKKPIPIEGAPPALTPVRRAESIKMPAGGSKISSWFSGKEPLEEDDYGPVNVSVRRPLKPTLAQPGDKASDYKVPPKMTESSLSASSRNGDTAVGGMGSKTDEWEKAKLARIREEYEKMIETIAEWEAEKKVKARRKKEQKETELDRKRAKVLEEYNQEMSRISKISVGARSMAEERKYNDKKKIREKANKMRSTGKLPRTCACF